MKLIPKYQQGFGIVPVGYTPLPWTVTATSGVATTTPDASTDDKTKKDKLFSDTIINSLKSNALTSDMEFFLEHSSAFSNQILSGIASAGSIEQQTKELLLYATKMENEKDEFTQATQRIRTIEAEGEIAISPDGYVFTYNPGTKSIQRKSISKLTNKDRILTNAQLANYRANDVKFAFNSDVTNTLTNATSFKEIRSVIDDAVKQLGETGEDEMNYYGSKNSHNENFLALVASMGLTASDLQKVSTDKLIEIKVKSKGNAKQLDSALDAIVGTLSPTQLQLVSLRSKQLGYKDFRGVILEYLDAKIKSSKSISLDIVNIKDGTKGSNKTSSDDSTNKFKLTPGMELGLELGKKVPVTINLGTKADLHAVGISRTITSKTGENIGQKLGVELLQSSLANNLQLDQITMGGAIIPEDKLMYTFINNGTAVAVNLPLDMKKASQGIVAPDLTQSKRIYEYLSQHKEATTPEQINKVLKDGGFDAMYQGTDAQGNPILNSTNYRKFVAIDIVADEQAFKKDETPEESLVAKVKKPTAFESQMRKFDSKLELSGEWFWPSFFKGSMFIPFDLNLVGSYAGTENDLTIDEAKRLTAIQQQHERLSQGIPEETRNVDKLNKLINNEKR